MIEWLNDDIHIFLLSFHLHIYVYMFVIKNILNALFHDTHSIINEL